MYRKYRVKIRTTAEQKSMICKYRDAQRYAYNWAVSQLKNQQEKNEYGLSVMFTAHKRKNQWMQAVPRIFFNMGIKDACVAYKLSKSHGHGNLKYRSKKNAKTTSLRCNIAPVCKDKYFVQLPRFGTVRGDVPAGMLDGTLEPRSYEFVDATRQHDAPIEKREYMLMVSCIVTPQAPKQGVLRIAKAIDRGTVEPTVVVTCDNSTGRITGKECLNTASPFKKNRTRYQKFQKKISKKNRRSKRYKRAVSQMQKQMRHVKNQRTYAECIAAKQICSNTDIIIMEKLPLKKMTCRGKGKKRHMNREMRFVRHTMLEQRIKNRAELYGIPILKINPRYTSQTCSRCGHISKESRVTRDSFKCVVIKIKIRKFLPSGGELHPLHPGCSITNVHSEVIHACV